MPFCIQPTAHNSPLTTHAAGRSGVGAEACLPEKGLPAEEVTVLAREQPGILKGLKTIEWLKAELLSAVGDIFRAMLRGSEELVLDGLARAVLSCYLLARRLGYGFTRLDLRVEDQVRTHLQAGHEVERWYGDLSALSRHLRDNRHATRPSGDAAGST